MGERAWLETGQVVRSNLHRSLLLAWNRNASLNLELANLLNELEYFVKMKSLMWKVIVLYQVQAQNTALVDQLRLLQAQALDLPPPSPSVPPPSFSPPPSSSPGLLPFIAPLQHPMLPSRPVQPASLQNKVPPSAGLDCSDLECTALDLLVHNPDFSIFVSLLQLADLIDILSLPGPVTIFAPTNKAFDGLPTPLFKSLLEKPKELQLALLRHLTKGDIKSSSFPSGSTPLVTGAGERLTITTFPRQVTISSDLVVGNIIETDNLASNGVIHVIDIVL